jgi:hypothetical protein
MLEANAETISGVNSVARGNPEASLKSGAALALVQSMALQFISGTQQAYVQMLEDVGTGLINMLKDFADVPRIALIAGKDNRVYVEKEFKGDDLQQINRVIVDISNPLSRTTPGKMQIASELIQYGIIKTPEQYLTIMNTGRLDAMTDDAQRELFQIKDENERMMAGEVVNAISIDQHSLHIKGHRAALDSETRNNPDITKILLAHIASHIELLTTTDPTTLSIIGEQPIQRANPPQNAQSPDQLNKSAVPSTQVETPPALTGPLPGMPKLPTVQGDLLPRPELQAQSLNNVR